MTGGTEGTEGTAPTVSGRGALCHRRGTAAELLDVWPSPASSSELRVAICHVVGPDTLVLGSTQGVHGGTGSVGLPRLRGGGRDPGARDVGGPHTVRRRSGGGAVWVAPGQQVWVEVWIPRDDPRWVDDVVASSWWVGDAWARALVDLGISGAVVHRGRQTARPDAAGAGAVCFAGLGPGEVTVGMPPRKVVGISQHRTRHGARMSTMAHLRWDAAPIVRALVRRGLVDPGRALEVAGAASAAAAGLGDLVAVPRLGQDLAAATEEAVARQLTGG